MVGQPDDETYKKIGSDAYDLMSEEASKIGLNLNAPSHRRGQFPAINTGVSHAMGSTKPFNINHDKYDEMIDRLVHHKYFRRLAGFASCT